MSITVNGGTVTIQNLGGPTQFVGCTTSEGQFLPTGQEYDLFTFTPKKGEYGTLVFVNVALTRAIGSKDLSCYGFYAFYWLGDKLIVEPGIKRWTRVHSQSLKMGFVVQFRDSLYITGAPASNANCKVVDLFEMLRYIEGRISLADLDRNARSYERRQQHEGRMKDLKAEVSRLSRDNSILEGAVSLGKGLYDYANRQVDAANKRVDEANRRAEEANRAYLTHYHAVVAMRPLRDRLRRFPRWLLSKASRQFLDAIGKTNLTT